MSTNILITGAAGYIGGTILDNFLSKTGGPIKSTKIYATARSDEQIKVLSKLGVNAFKLDLNDEAAVVDAVVRNEIDLVVHTASCMTPELAINTIRGLGKRHKATGKDVHFVYTSVTAIYTPENGWPTGQWKDTDAIYETEKKIGGGNPARKCSILVNDEAVAEGVKSYNMPVPMVYGRGTGQWRKLSVLIPKFVRASIAHRVVYRFDVDGSPPAAHVEDSAELYALMVEKILRKESIPSGPNGFYFAFVHRLPWWTFLDRLAEKLHARGLVDEPTTKVWPSDDMAAEVLELPRTFVRAMGTHTGDLVAVNPFELGWEPKWDQKRFLESTDDEIQAVFDLDSEKTKPSLFENIMHHTEK